MFAKAMADLSDQKFQISVYGPGEIVPAFQVVDAVAEGATLSAFARSPSAKRPDRKRGIRST